MRLGWLAGVALLTAMAPGSASAAPTSAPSKAACIEAYKSSQELSRSGALTKARSAALVCARAPCPAVLQKDCADWVADIQQRVPTVIVVLHDEGGRDVAVARVEVDGVEVATRLDGRPIEVDPGEHKVQVTAEGRPPLELSIIAREREKGREVLFSFEPPKTASPLLVPLEGAGPEDKPRARPLPWTFWAATGVSGAALAGFGVFGASGLALRGDLDACRPNCSQERIDHGQSTFLVADVALGVAVVAAGIATFIYVTRP